MPALRSTRTDKRPARKAPARGSRAAVESSEEPELLAVQLDEEEDDDDDDEEEEEEAETRCICGKTDPPDADGLYIQCEKCSVWQHGFCVTISGNVPEKYWCELCRPELHSITVKGGEKKSKYLPVQPKEPTRKPPRRGAGAGAGAASKGSHTPTEDESEQATKRNRRERATQDARFEAMIQRVMEESKKDANQSDIKSEDDDSKAPTSSGRSSRTNRRRKHEEEEEEEDDNDENNNEEDTTKEPFLSKDTDDSMLEADTSKANASFSKPRVSKLKKDSTENDSSAPESSATTGKAKKQKRTKNVNKSPQKEKDSSIDFNKPTKPRLPQQRTTINEMRRRVAAILEFIGRTQVDIASEQSDKDEMTKYVDDEESKQRIEKLFDNYTGSLEQMDVLTRKLLTWEQNFGKFGDK